MLASRSLRLAITRCYRPAFYAWSVQTKIPLIYQQSTWYTTPMIAAYSKDAKSNESTFASSGQSVSDQSIKPTEAPATPLCRQPTSPSSSSSSTKSPLSDLDVKLPSREQVESFFFKSLVYLWDFTFYVYALSRKLFENYVVHNATVQQYWKVLLKRMDEARKEIKSK